MGFASTGPQCDSVCEKGRREEAHGVLQLIPSLLGAWEEGGGQVGAADVPE